MRGLGSFGPLAERVDCTKSIVLHADDFGMSRAVNAGIVRGFTHGLLTSTSILTNAPEWLDAVSKWKDLLFHQRHGALASATMRRELNEPPRPFELGVHLNLTQGRPITGLRYAPALLDSSGRFPGIGRLFRRMVFSGGRFAECIRCELSAQIERLYEQGIVPTHLNGHQYLELIPGVGSIVLERARYYSIPVVRVAWEPGLTSSTLRTGFDASNWCLSQIKRLFACRLFLQARRAGISFPRAYFGTGHAGRVNLKVMECFLASARGYATVEIGLHPGDAPTARERDEMEEWCDPLAERRVAECRLLTCPELGALLKHGGFRLGRLNESSMVRGEAAAA